MFDSAPPNLPVEPGGTPTSTPPPLAPVSAPSMPSVPPPPPTRPPSGKKEPEDIFADLDQGNAGTGEPAPVFEQPKRTFPVQMVLIAIGIIVIVGAIGAAVWFFLIKPQSAEPTLTPTTSQNPPVVTAEPEPVVETPVAVPQTTPPPNVPPPQPISNPPKVEPTEAPDSDGDGLSNPEEQVLGTNNLATDSDGDGFGDGAELQSGYDPATARTTLAASSYFRSADIANSWTVLLPTAWSLGADATTPGDYAIQTGTPTTFTVHLSQKSSQTTFADWLAANDPTADPSTFEAFTTRAGYPAWRSSDRLVTYITADTTVVVIHYRVNTSTSYDYRALYDHVVQTIKEL